MVGGALYAPDGAPYPDEGALAGGAPYDDEGVALGGPYLLEGTVMGGPDGTPYDVEGGLKLLGEGGGAPYVSLGGDGGAP